MPRPKKIWRSPETKGMNNSLARRRFDKIHRLLGSKFSGIESINREYLLMGSPTYSYEFLFLGNHSELYTWQSIKFLQISIVALLARLGSNNRKTNEARCTRLCDGDVQNWKECVCEINQSWPKRFCFPGHNTQKSGIASEHAFFAFDAFLRWNTCTN